MIPVAGMMFATYEVAYSISNIAYILLILAVVPASSVIGDAVTSRK